MKAAVLSILRVYKRWLSPALPVSCRYLPTCSEYAMEAVETHGTIRGLALAAWRLARCNPLGGSGYDPVPHACKPAEHHCERTRNSPEGAEFVSPGRKPWVA
jgi:putative membrane protein insertion efficiency factor